MRFLFFLLLPVVCVAQKDRIKAIDKYMIANAEVKQFSGAVLVAKDGKVIYRKSFGEADKEWKISNTVDTRFRIGSNTKQFTAACILKLAEEGKLSLDDKLSKYFPDYPKADSVTIHMLLSHTSGITNYTDHDDFWEGPAFVQISHDSLISLFRKKPYDFSPGTNCSYSNSGYILLGSIIEIVSKEDYYRYLQNNIIQPAGMINSVLDRFDTIMPMRARGYYQKRNGLYYNSGYVSLETIWSAGAIISTLDDLYSWTKSLHGNKILTAASVKRMTTQYGVTREKDRFGYGLIIDSVENHARIWHDGSVPGFSSFVAYYPKDDLCIIALTNNSFSASKIGTGLTHLVFGLEIEHPYVHKEISLSEQQLDKFTGKYRATATFEIVRKEGKLFHKLVSGSEMELKPESETRLFYNNNSDRQLQFIFNKNGEIVKVFLIDSGIKKEIEKLDNK